MHKFSLLVTKSRRGYFWFIQLITDVLIYDLIGGRVKRSGCKPDHSAKVKNDCICTGFEKSARRPYYGLGSRISVGSTDFSLLQNVHAASGTHSASNSMRVGALSWDLSGRVVRLNSRFHLVRRLRMSEAIRQLPIYAFMVKTGEDCTSYFL